jgi:signal transduction histidine kinase
MREALTQFFALNRPLVYFLYGLVFFVLGLAILLQSRSHSRLYLARRLEWLALFGLLHGLHEWGDLFIPIQVAYLSEATYGVLLAVHQVLLVASFVCLYEFAVSLLRPLPPGWAWVRWLPIVSLLLWGLAVAGNAITGSAVPWTVNANVAARYLVGLPAAVLAGSALIRRAPALLAPLDDASTVRLLRTTGAAMLGYAVAACLFVPQAPFFPANTLNVARIEGAIAVPVPVLRSLIATVIVVAIVRTLDVFDREIARTLSAVEEAQVLEAERARLGRDLHDRTLQSVYAAGLILATCFETQRREGAASAAEAVARAMLALDRAVEDLRVNIAELRSPPTSVNLQQGLLDRIRGSAVEAMAPTTIQVDVPDSVRLSPRTVGHVLAIAGEALSNVARHSGAQHVSVTAHVEEGRLHLAVGDDGRGLPIDYISGYGLENMRERARLLDGELKIVTVPGGGTSVNLSVPLSAPDAQGRP